MGHIMTDHVHRKFPAHTREINRLLQANAVFKEICADYEEICTWLSKHCRSKGRRTVDCEIACELIRELENEGRQLADEIILKSGKEILALREEALKDLQIQMETAKKEIRTETDTLAVNIMEKVLDRRLVS